MEITSKDGDRIYVNNVDGSGATIYVEDNFEGQYALIHLTRDQLIVLHSHIGRLLDDQPPPKPKVTMKLIITTLIVLVMFLTIGLFQTLLFWCGVIVGLLLALVVVYKYHKKKVP